MLSITVQSKVTCPVFRDGSTNDSSLQVCFRPRGYETFYMLSSGEHEISLLIIFKLLTVANFFLLNIAKHENFSANKYENVIVGIFIFISREEFMLS